ncbi:hypothetical protein BH09PSE4_BH09PSE4_00330 [soil metagenome]
MTAVVPTLEFAFRLTTQMGQRMKFGTLPNGGSRRGFTATTGGKVEGPMLNGIVLPNSGGDYPIFDHDDNAFFDARYILQADDGTPIYMQLFGMRIGTPEVNKRLRANEVVPMTDYYFRTNPRFEVPKGPYDWMSRSIFIGSADRREDYSTFDIYKVL